MIKEGNQICFKAKCLHYDASADEYHFLIQKIKKSFTIKKDKKTYKKEKSARFKATCLYVDSTKFSISLDECKCKPELLDIEFSQADQEHYRIVHNFLIKSRIMFYLCWRYNDNR